MTDRPTPAEAAALAHVVWGEYGVHESLTGCLDAVLSHAAYLLEHDGLTATIRRAFERALTRPDADLIADRIGTPRIAPWVEPARDWTGPPAPAPRALFEAVECVTYASSTPDDIAAAVEEIRATVDHMRAFTSAFLTWCDQDEDLRAHIDECAGDTLPEIAEFLRDVTDTLRTRPAPTPDPDQDDEEDEEDEEDEDQAPTMHRWPHEPTLTVETSERIIVVNPSALFPYRIVIEPTQEGWAEGWWVDLAPAGPCPPETPSSLTIHVERECVYENGTTPRHRR